MLDKVEPPSIPEGYAMSVAFSALLDLVRSITSIIEKELAKEEEEAAAKGEVELSFPPPSEESPQEPRKGWSLLQAFLNSYESCLVFCYRKNQFETFIGDPDTRGAWLQNQFTF